MGVASMVGLFYYGYSPFSLVAGVAMDGSGRARSCRSARRRSASARCCSRPATAQLASVGRLLQGAGGVFALVGAVYIATTNFPASRAATLIGATQMFGMAGGSAGQFVVGPMIGARRAVEHVLDRHGRRRPGDQRAAVLAAAAAAERAASGGDWLSERRARAAASSSAIRSRSCAA